jgi:hypothetical protein
LQKSIFKLRKKPWDQEAKKFKQETGKFENGYWHMELMENK